MLSKLEKSGVLGTVLDWFASYLCNREYFAKISSCVSSTKFINIGLPLGSILGPILFLVYANDLPNVSSLLQPILLAAGTTVFVSLSIMNFIKFNNGQFLIDSL